MGPDESRRPPITANEADRFDSISIACTGDETDTSRGAQTASNWTCRSHLYMPRADVRGRQLLAYSVEKLCFEAAANGSGPLERSQSCAHGGVPATHHLSPTSRCGACRVARDPSSPTAQQSRRIRRPSEIEFFNRIGPIRSFGRSVAIASKPTFVRADRVANAGAAKSHASTRRVRFPLTSPSPSYRCDVPS